MANRPRKRYSALVVFFCLIAGFSHGGAIAASNQGKALYLSERR